MTEPAERHSVASRVESPLDRVPYRVISLVPGMTETLVDLDLGDRLIAVTDRCTRPAGALDHLPRVGDPQAADCERIIALAPDLVILGDGVNHPDDAEQLRQAGLALWITGPRSLFEVLNLLWGAMHIFDHTAMAPRVQAIERAYDITRGASQARTPVRVFAAIERDPWQTVCGGESYPDDVLRVCGGANVFAERDDSTFTVDEVLAAQPEVVLLPAGPDAVDWDDSRDVALFAALDIPAAHTGRIHPIDASLLTWPGTRAAYALRDLPALLMPDSME